MQVTIKLENVNNAEKVNALIDGAMVYINSFREATNAHDTRRARLLKNLIDIKVTSLHAFLLTQYDVELGWYALGRLDKLNATLASIA